MWAPLGNSLLISILLISIPFADPRYVTRDPRVLTKIIQENQGIIEWIIEHIEDAIQELEKASTIDVYECLVGMAYVIQDTTKAKMWALQMIDSSAKIPNGLLQGGLTDLGIYDECVAIENPNPEMPFTGMHCLVDFKISLPSNMTLEIDGSSMSIVTLLGSNVLTLTFGHCYPSVCQPYIIQDAYNLLLGRVSNWTGGSYGINVVVNPSDCHLSERDVLQTSDWLMIMVFAIVLFTAAVSTTLDLAYFRHALKTRRPNLGEQAALSFSLYTNGKKLLNLKQSSESISIVNGMKFLSIGWVVLGHRYRYLGEEPLSNYISVASAIKQWTKMLIISGPLAVDTFFLIGGLLNMYTFLKIKSKRPSFSIVDIFLAYIHRYIRVTPAYAVAVAFTATLLYRLGDGPEWDRIVGTAQEDCRESWWKNMLYINNYNVDNYCMMQSWYLSADMQMFWAAPLVVVPLWKWPIVGFIELFVLLVLSVISPFYTAWYYKLASPIPLSADTDLNEMVMRTLYLPTHTKFTSYVVGIFVGYAIYKFRSGEWEFRMNRVINLSIWTACSGLMLYSVFGGYPIFQLDYNYNRWYSSFYIGFYRLFWSFGLAWIILACDNGWGGPVNAILSWEIFQPLGKLTYCLYLVHVGVMLVGIGSIRHTIYYSDFIQTHDFLGDMVINVMVAAAFSLLFEAPLMTLEKLVFSPQRRKPILKPVEELPEARVIIPSAPLENGSQNSQLLKRRTEPVAEESTDL